jgi:hypothetical protein
MSSKEAETGAGETVERIGVQSMRDVEVEAAGAEAEAEAEAEVEAEAEAETEAGDEAGAWAVAGAGGGDLRGDLRRVAAEGDLRGVCFLGVAFLGVAGRGVGVGAESVFRS